MSGRPTHINAMTLYQHAQALKAKRTAIREANAALLPAALERVFQVTSS